MNFKEFYLLNEGGGGGSAFGSLKQANIAADSLNYGKKGPFYPKYIGNGYWQLVVKKKKDDNIVEEVAVPLKIYDRIFIMPGEKPGEALAWMGHDLFKLKKRGGKTIASRKEGTEFKSIKVPHQFKRTKVNKAIVDTLRETLVTEGTLKPIVAASLMGLSSILGTDVKDFSKLNIDKEPKKEMTEVRAVNVNPKLYSEILIKAENDPVMHAIAKHESRFDPKAVGDKHLTNHAYGLFQIRKPALIDVNERFGTSYKEEDLVPKSNLRSDVDKAIKVSIDVYKKYLSRYKMADKTPEEIAKFWNGGPLAKKIGTIEKASVPAKYAKYRSNLDRYWKHVQRFL